MSLCRISTNSENEVMEVYTVGNNKPSQLWASLVAETKAALPNISEKEQKKIATDKYMNIYTTGFQKTFNWVRNPQLVNRDLDENGEPKLDILKKFLNRGNTGSSAPPPEAENNEPVVTQFNKDAFDYINALETQARDINLPVEGAEDNFYTKAGKQYERLTHWVHDVISSQRFKYDTPEETTANKLFNKKYGDVFDKEKDTINYVGQELTFPQLREVLKSEFDGYKYKGKIIHGIIETYLSKDSATKAEVSERVDKFYADSGLDPKGFRYLNDTYIHDLLQVKLGINLSEGKFADRVISEIPITSDVFGIGTTIDGLVQHADGSVSIVDFKSGTRFLDNEFIDQFVEYGIRANMNIRDNKIDRARIELAIRAMILKETYPDIKIRNVQLAHLQYDINETRIINVDLHEFLPWMKDFLEFYPQDLVKSARRDKKESSKIEKLNKAEQIKGIYNRANKAGVFNADSYETSAKTILEDTEIQEMFNKNASKQDILNFLEKRLDELTTYSNDKSEELKDTAAYVNIQREIQKTREQISNVLKTDSESIDIQDEEDMSWLKKNFGNLYTVKNPLVQQVIRSIGSKMQLANQIIDRRVAQFDVLEHKLVEEYHKTKGTISTQNLGLNQKELWSFMTEVRTEKMRLGDDINEREVKGEFRKIITPEEVKQGLFTQTQYEYNKLVNDTFEERAKEFEKVAYIDSDGKAVTKAQLRGIDLNHFRKSYMPRVSITETEALENIGPKNYFKRLWSAKVREFFKNQTKNRNPNLIPVKYLENEYHFSNPDNYSHRWGYIMRESYKNLVYEEKLSSGYAYAKATEKFLQLDKTALDSDSKQTKFKNTIEWLNGWTKMMLISDNEELLYTGKPIYFTINGKKRQVNFGRLVEGMDNFVTMNAMWFKPISGLFNGFLNVLLTSQKALNSYFAKYAGVKNPELTIENFAKGNSHWFKSSIFMNNNLYDLRGNKTLDSERNGEKMEFFMNYFGFDSNKFSYTTSTTDLNDAKLALVNKGLPFVFHQVGESYSQAVLLAGQLEQLKTTVNGEEVSMWDAYKYDEDTKTFKYNGDVRFIDNLGNAITEPTYEEIAKMKRTYERIHGGYKSEEKMLIEMTAIGRWIVKFRKFIPSQIFENLQGEYDDWSIGGWGNEVDPKTGEPILKDGETVVQWISRSNQGRLRLFTNWLRYCARVLNGDPRYAWENLNDYQKQQLISMATNVIYGLSTAVAIMAIMGGHGDDDDKLKNNSVFRRANRLKEDMMSLNPFGAVTYLVSPLTGTNPSEDLLRTAAQPLLQPTQLYNLAKASWSFFFDGVMMGETIKTGPNKGNLKGSTQFKKAVPLISSVSQWDIFMKDKKAYSKDMNNLENTVLSPEESSWLSKQTENQNFGR